MTQKIKERLEQAAETAWEQDQKTNPSPVNPHAYVYGYKAGAQTILENPGKWGLIDAEIHSNVVKRNFARTKEVNQLQSQLAKYREALERIVNTSTVDAIAYPLQTVSEFYNIAKEALKHEDTTCPKCGYPLFNRLGKTCCQGCDYVKQQ